MFLRRSSADPKASTRSPTEDECLCSQKEPKRSPSIPRKLTTDRDGNEITRPSSVGVVCRAVVQPVGTPTETEEIGFLTDSRYRLRLVGYQTLLGAQAAVEWQGKRYAIEAEPRQFNGSRRTAHVDCVISRG